MSSRQLQPARILGKNTECFRIEGTADRYCTALSGSVKLRQGLANHWVGPRGVATAGPAAPSCLLQPSDVGFAHIVNAIALQHSDNLDGLPPYSSL